MVQTSHHELGSATTSHQTSSRGRGQGEDRAGSTTATNPSSARAPTITSCSGGRQKAAPQPPAQREPPLDAREELLQGQVGGLGGARPSSSGVRRNGRNRGMPYERTKRLPVTDLNVALSRQSEGLSDAAARNLKASVRAAREFPSRTTLSWSCPTRPTTWTRRGSGPSASRPCRSPPSNNGGAERGCRFRRCSRTSTQSPAWEREGRQVRPSAPERRSAGVAVGGVAEDHLAPGRLQRPERHARGSVPGARRGLQGAAPEIEQR